MDAFGVMSLFTDNNYREVTYEYEGHTIKLQALETASTDFDLTGQIVWQAADIFAKFMLASNMGESLFS